MHYTIGMFLHQTLPADIEQLQRLCRDLQSALEEKQALIHTQQQALAEKEKTVQEKQAHIDYLHEQLSLLRSKRYLIFPQNTGRLVKHFLPTQTSLEFDC